MGTIEEGFAVGEKVGDALGASVGRAVGISVGAQEGASVGVAVGVTVEIQNGYFTISLKASECNLQTVKGPGVAAPMAGALNCVAACAKLVPKVPLSTAEASCEE